MKRSEALFSILSISAIALLNGAAGPTRKNGDDKIQLRNTPALILEKTEELSAQSGVKSVLFNSRGTKLYALNLEGMSIYEFDRASRKILREFRFRPTEAAGWDYGTNKSVPSFAEKPVEACFSHDDRILWVSLHNAGGIVPIRLDSVELNEAPVSGKTIYVGKMDSDDPDTISVPLVRTGRTPKVIARTADSRYLLVSNWHSGDISILRTNDTILPYAEKISGIPVKGIPRGVAVDDRSQKSYIAVMSGNNIIVLNNRTFKVEKNLSVGYNPRHIVAGEGGKLFVSFNALNRVSCISGSTGKVLFQATTHARPRTIVLSKDQKFLFVTCYEGNCLDIYRIGSQGFTRIASLDCKGKPVGADLYEDEEKLEVWVCNYLPGTIRIFTFRKV